MSLTVRSNVQNGISEFFFTDERVYETTSQAAPNITASSNKTAATKATSTVSIQLNYNEEGVGG